MKRIIILLFLAKVSVITAQKDILTDSILKSGIYITVDNIVTNRPIPNSNLEIQKSYIKIGDLLNRYSMERYNLNIPKKESKKMRTILGFCDGKNIYLAPEPTYSHLKGFYKAKFVGNFIYFESIRLSISSGATYSVINIIDLKENTLLVDLQNAEMKKIMADNPELLEKFKKEKHKKSVYQKYLKEYSLKN